jgi:hypothetical protein
MGLFLGAPGLLISTERKLRGLGIGVVELRKRVELRLLRVFLRGSTWQCFENDR